MSRLASRHRDGRDVRCDGSCPERHPPPGEPGGLGGHADWRRLRRADRVRQRPLDRDPLRAPVEARARSVRHVRLRRFSQRRRAGVAGWRESVDAAHDRGVDRDRRADARAGRLHAVHRPAAERQVDADRLPVAGADHLRRGQQGRAVGRVPGTRPTATSCGPRCAWSACPTPSSRCRGSSWTSPKRAACSRWSGTGSSRRSHSPSPTDAGPPEGGHYATTRRSVRLQPDLPSDCPCADRPTPLSAAARSR